jgi:precorrin-4/cobalt-precorrin-4 C11-methyltransferase
VSAFSAVAAYAQQELTIPGVAQSVILTRMEGGKTPMPDRERLRDFAAHGTTIALYLSAARTKRVADELLAGGYGVDTPVIVGYRVTWPDEMVFRCRLDEVAKLVRERQLWKHTLFLVGPALSGEPDGQSTRSHLYHPGHFHGYRRADLDARTRLRSGSTDAHPPGASATFSAGSASSAAQDEWSGR